MKKIISTILSMILVAVFFCSCSSNAGNSSAAGGSNSDSSTSGGSTAGAAINVISREDGSGTRGAFVELMKIEDENKNDATTDKAEITNSTSVMMTTVAGNVNSIGYVSLGSVSDDVKKLKVDGVEATVENIKSGSYKVSRPFNICYKDGSLSEVSQDFIDFIMSEDGQKIIADEGYISVETSKKYTASGKTGTISLSGSTSVSPVMEVLADAYKALNADVKIEIEQTGSSAGITSAIDGVSDIGMSSRDLKDEEKTKLKSECIAMDGIAVIVNKENTIDNLSSEQIMKIYTSEITKWDELK